MTPKTLKAMTIKSILASTAALSLSAHASPSLAQSPCNWAGTWDTDLGELKMTQNGDRVSGTFTQLYKTRIMGPVSRSRGQCVGDLTVMGRNVDAGAMRGTRIVLSGNGFSGSVDDGLNDNVTMTRFTGTRQVKSYDFAPLATNQVKRGVVADNKVLNRRVNERVVGQKLDQPMVKLKSAPMVKADKVARSTGANVETLDGLPTVDQKPHSWGRFLPWITERSETFRPRFIEMELVEFASDRAWGKGVYGLMGLYAGCNSNTKQRTLAPLNGDKNRIFQQTDTSRDAAEGNEVFSQPSRTRTRRFVLDMSCYSQPGGDLYVQAQTNFKINRHLGFDTEYGYQGFAVNLSRLLEQDDGVLNPQFEERRPVGCSGATQINTVTRAADEDTEDMMVFDWYFSAFGEHPDIEDCQSSVESHVKIRIRNY